MRKTLMGLFKMLLVLVIMLYAEQYCTAFLTWLGLDLKLLTPLWQEVIILIIYGLILACVYIFYRADLANDWSRFKRNWFPNLLMAIVFFAIITIVVWVVSYLSEVGANALKVKFMGLNHLNVFREPLSLQVVIFIIKNIIIIPFIYCTVYILGIYEIFKSEKMSVVGSGLIAAIVASLSIKGSLLMIAINVIPYFTLYFGLAYIYRKNNHNIWFALTSVILYTFLASVLIERIAR